MSGNLRDLQLEATTTQQSECRSNGSLASSELLRQVDVCQQLGISDQTWMRWRAAGLTPEAVVMPSGRLKWRRADIDRLAGKPEERPGRRLHFGSVHGRKSAARVA